MTPTLSHLERITLSIGTFFNNHSCDIVSKQARISPACPLLEGVNLAGARGVLVNITASLDADPERLRELTLSERDTMNVLERAETAHFATFVCPYLRLRASKPRRSLPFLSYSPSAVKKTDGNLL